MNREQMETILRERGIVYSGVAKSYVGEVSLNQETKLPKHEKDTFGYYLRKDGIWIVFVTDSERGIELTTYTCSSKEESLNRVFEMSERNYYINLSESVIKNFREKEPIILAYLMQEYNYSEEKANEELDYLKQNKFIAFEFAYYIEHREFIPNKYATEYSGYTAEKLNERADLTLVGAFNYLIYLPKNPVEAMANLHKRLPRR